MRQITANAFGKVLSHAISPSSDVPIASTTIITVGLVISALVSCDWASVSPHGACCRDDDIRESITVLYHRRSLVYK